MLLLVPELGHFPHMNSVQGLTLHSSGLSAISHSQAHCCAAAAANHDIPALLRTIEKLMVSCSDHCIKQLLEGYPAAASRWTLAFLELAQKVSFFSAPGLESCCPHAAACGASDGSYKPCILAKAFQTLVS